MVPINNFVRPDSYNLQDLDPDLEVEKLKFFHGIKTLTECEEILRCKQRGHWLLRFSASQNKYVITYKSENHQVCSIIIDKEEKVTRKDIMDALTNNDHDVKLDEKKFI